MFSTLPKITMKYLKILILAALFASCSKYEENEGITLESKTNRLVGTWSLVEINDAKTETIMDSIGYFKLPSYYAPVDIYVYETYLKKENNFWEFEGDFELKERTTQTTYRLNYGKTSSAKALVYDTIGPTEELLVKKWAFSNKKQELKIKSSTTNVEFNILKLTTEELKLEDDFGNTLLFQKD